MFFIFRVQDLDLAAQHQMITKNQKSSQHNLNANKSTSGHTISN